MKHTLALLILMFFSSCVLFSQTNDNSTIEDYRKEIIGTWINENNSNTKIEFTNDGKIKRYFKNTLKFINKYYISRTCDGEMTSLNKGYFLKTITNKGNEFCAYIEGLNYENNGLFSIMTKNQGKIVVYKKQ